MLMEAKNIFIVGMKGVAMANLALILKKMGKTVAGSDVDEEFITDELLKKNEIGWQVGFNTLPDETDLIIYSAAHGGTNNPQVIEAKKRDIKVISQAEILDEIMGQFKIKIAVCGSHGKTTTASLLAYSLIKLGKKPSYLVGAPSFNNFWGGDYQNSDYFIVEADEYGVNPPFDKTPKFNFLKPDYIICTNIDFDHPDVYRNLEEIKKTFLKFFDGKKLFLCANDKSLMEVAKQLPKNNYLTFKESLISHTGGVALCLSNLGFKNTEIKEAMRDFTGAKRRFELVYNGGVTLYDDYAHHPKEIEATIAAARARFPKQRLIIIFQPHTYSRTQSLLPDFARSLSLADLAYILPIFPSAREKTSDFHVSSSDIVKLNPNKLFSVSSTGQLLKLLASTLQPQDVIFTMGAGDVYKLKDDIIRVCSNPEK